MLLDHSHGMVRGDAHWHVLAYHRKTRLPSDQTTPCEGRPARRAKQIAVVLIRGDPLSTVANKKEAVLIRGCKRSETEAGRKKTTRN